MSTFPARYPGRCPCGEAFSPGDEVFYSDNTLVGVDCCGTDIVVTMNTTPGRPAITTPAPVLPHGRTIRDRCPGCFQIPATNGVCGCP